MAFSRGELEYLHSIGKVPDWVYYQTNGDDIQWNYLRQKEEIRKRFFDREKQQQQEKDIEKQIEDGVRKALEKLFDDFRK